MTDSALLGLFGSRTVLPAGCATFAGADSRLRILLATVGGAHTTNSVSVVGPRRSGRSSLLRQLSHQTYLDRYSPLQGAIVVQADFRGFRGRPESAVDYLHGKLVERLQEMTLPCETVIEAKNMADAVRDALKIIPARLLFVIDDFEAVGSDLRKDEQADLRQAVYDRPRVGYVIASRLPLSRCLQEFGDSLSDLAPIVTSLPELLMPLQEREIRAMIGAAVAGDPISQVGAAAAEFVYKRVGGQPLWIQQALAALTSLGNKAIIHANALTPAELRDVEREIVRKLEYDWLTGIRQLSAAARDAFEDLRNVDRNTSSDVFEELWQTGWAQPDETGSHLKPAGTLVEFWLSRRLWMNPSTPNPNREEPYDRLVGAVDELNTAYRRVHGGKAHLLRPNVFFSASYMPFLRRRARSLSDFAHFIGALATLLQDEVGAGGAGRPALPRWCYNTPQCIVHQVMELRTWVEHLLREPESPPAKMRVHADLDAFRRCVGVSSEKAPSYELLTDCIMEKVIGLVELMAALLVDIFSPRADALGRATGDEGERQEDALSTKWLTEFPLRWDGRRWFELANLLRNAYPTLERIKALAESVPVALENWNQTHRIAEAWKSLLEEASRQKKMLDLVLRVLEDMSVVTVHGPIRELTNLPAPC